MVLTQRKLTGSSSHPKHWIQRHIVSTLTLAPTRRHAELRPTGVETNLFTYHLQQLLKTGLVIKQDETYSLSNEGKRYSGYINVDTGEPRPQPKITVMIFARNAKGQIALFRWKRQPFYGLVSLPYGKTDFGNTIEKNAQEELHKKLGLRGTLKHRGDVYVLTNKDGAPINHMLTHIFEIMEPTGELRSAVPSGEAFWGEPDKLTTTEVVPGFFEIYKLVSRSRPEHFFVELEVSF